MKINCYKIKIDMKEIQKGIDKFHCIHGERPSYIIMNWHTREEMMFDMMKFFEPSGLSSIRRIAKIYDIPVAVSENLEDGEVDIV